MGLAIKNTQSKFKDLIFKSGKVPASLLIRYVAAELMTPLAVEL